MLAAKTLFLSLAPLMVTESLPLILITVVYEVDIIRYLFLGHPTRPVPPSRRKLDYIGFLPIPDKAKSWQGSLVAVICGLVWFFSEFTLDIILIILGVDSAKDLRKQIQQHEQQYEQQHHYDDHDDIAVVEDSHEGVKAKSMHSHHHHHHHDIYDNSDEYFGDHQPQQQQYGGRRWRRECRRDDDSSYDYDTSEKGDDLQDELLVWNLKERSVEYKDEGDALFAVSAALNLDLTLGADADEEERKAVLSSGIAALAASDLEGEQAMDLQEMNDRQSSPMAEIRLLPAAAQDLECAIDVLSDPDTQADADADADADAHTEAADAPRSVSSSPLSSTSTSCTNLHSETEMKENQRQAYTKDDFTDNTKAWVQLSVTTKTAETPTLNDCRMTFFTQQHGDDKESAESVHGHHIEQSQEQWLEWGPHQLSRAVKSVRSTQEQQPLQEHIVASPSSRRHMVLFPPLSPLAAESTAESLTDDGRIREEKKKAQKYAKKKKAAKAKKASGMPLSTR
ncbi:hypothetical protein BGZ97_010017 [Linnemannia gamsii]|uniref:Uncharacterized protein n=1 Tax=Linnemannia gamsii TaxID=64522 RepID=A0A9P6RMH8_9FUNG|nr:hypothetical protein BGZ97_010017 [Linnemannia gamsii]